MPHPHTGRPPFVGRVEESAALDDALEAAIDGQFVGVVVSGESGVGKTSLVRRFAEDAAEAQVAINWGNCRELGGSPPFWPWIQVMRAMGEEDTGAAVLEARPEDPFTVIDGLTESLRRRTREPRLVVLDDLQDADLGSLELLRHLCRGRFEVPLLVIATLTRHVIGDVSGDGDGAGREAAIGDILRNSRRLHLADLSEKEIAALLDATLGEPKSARERGARVALATTINERSGGNPLYAQGLIDAMVERNVDAMKAIPAGIRAVVRARLSPLSAKQLHVLSVAALHGKGFDVDVVGELLDLPPADVLVELAAPLASGIVDADGPHFRFHHRMIAEVLVDDMDPLERRSFHLRLARIVGMSASPLVPDVSRSSLVAMHLVESGDLAEPLEVAGWLDRATSDARRVRAFGDAAHFGDLAARHWRAGGDTGGEAEALTGVVNDHLATGAGDAAVARVRDLAALGRRLDSGELLARAALARAEVFDADQLVEGADLLAEALAHRDNDDDELRADLLCNHASMLGTPSFTGMPIDPPAARRAVAELRDLAARADTARVRAALATAELNVMSGPLHYASRRRWFAEGVGANQSDRLLDQLERAYWATSLAFEDGDTAGVEAGLAAWRTLTERSSSTYWKWRQKTALGGHLYLRGRFEDAAATLSAALPLVVNLYPAMAFRVYAGLLFAVRRDQGRLGELPGELVSIAEEHAGFAEHLDGHGLAVLAPVLALEAGDVEGARAGLAPIVAAARSASPDELFWLCLMSVVATCADGVGDVETSRWAAEQLEPFREQMIMWGRSFVPGGPVSMALGCAYRGAGDTAAAISSFRQTLEWAERAGAPAFAARAELALADLADDAGVRRRLLEAAHRRAQSIGMTGVERTTATLLGVTDSRDDSTTGEAPDAQKAVVRVLGRFEVVPVGGEVAARWSSRKARDALKILVCQRGRSTPREQLIDLLWPEASVSTGRSRLSVVLSMVRAALDPARRLASDPLQADRQAVALDLDVVAVDAEKLLRGVATARELRRRGDHDDALGLLRDVVAAAPSHDALAEDPYADWSAGFRFEVERSYREAVRALAEAASASGDADEAAHWQARLVELDPDDPEANEELLQALHQAGRDRDAQAHRRNISARERAQW